MVLMTGSLGVLAGSFTRPVSAAGAVIHADFGPLGAIGVSFV
jgi:2-oxo-hept-3-ene-1,7-dioate hydratase